MSSNEAPAVVSSLPPKPIPESVLDSLEQHESVANALPTMSRGGTGGREGVEDELVYNFVLQVGETHHALVLDGALTELSETAFI